MKTKLLSAAMLLVLACGNMLAQTKTATLVLTSSAKYQYIDGFGGTGIPDMPWWLALNHWHEGQNGA